MSSNLIQLKFNFNILFPGSIQNHLAMNHDQSTQTPNSNDSYPDLVQQLEKLFEQTMEQNQEGDIDPNGSPWNPGIVYLT